MQDGPDRDSVADLGRNYAAMSSNCKTQQDVGVLDFEEVA